MNSSDFAYILDLVASFWVIQSIILRSRKRIEIESAAFWDANPFILESQLLSFCDGWFGILLLLIGTLLHLNHFDFDQVVFWLLLVLVLLMSVLFRSVLKRKVLDFVKKKYPNYEEAKKSFT